MYLIGFLIIGLVAGLLVGWFMKGRGADLVGYVVIGVTGSSVGGMLFGTLGTQHYSSFGSLIAAVAGAAVFLFLIEAAKKI